MGEKRAKQELKKRRQRETLRRWRAKQETKDAPQPLPKSPFIFTAGGTCRAKDLDALGVGVGWVSSEGRWTSESNRYSQQQVAEEVVRRLSEGEELGAVWLKALDRWVAAGIVSSLESQRVP